MVADRDTKLCSETLFLHFCRNLFIQTCVPASLVYTSKRFSKQCAIDRVLSKLSFELGLEAVCSWYAAGSENK